MRMAAHAPRPLHRGHMRGRRARRCLDAPAPRTVLGDRLNLSGAGPHDSPILPARRCRHLVARDTLSASGSNEAHCRVRMAELGMIPRGGQDNLRRAASAAKFDVATHFAKRSSREVKHDPGSPSSSILASTSAGLRASCTRGSLPTLLDTCLQCSAGAAADLRSDSRLDGRAEETCDRAQD